MLLLATVVSLALAEIGLRVVGFRFQLHPESLEFGYPDPEMMDAYFQRHEHYLWVSESYGRRLALARAQPELDLVMMGCSCTEWGKFGIELAKAVEESGAPPLRAANLGVSGWSTYQGLQQARRDVLELSPRIATIFYGWNDHWFGFGVDDATAGSLAAYPLLGLQDLRMVQLATKVAVGRRVGQAIEEGGRPRRVPLASFRDNLREMVRTLRSNDIVPVLMTAPSGHEQGAEPEYLQERWLEDLSELVPLHRSYVEVVREVSRELGVVLCDLAAAFDEEPLEVRQQLFLEDGIHFSPEGSVKVGRLLHRCLAENGLVTPAAGARSESGEDG